MEKATIEVGSEVIEVTRDQAAKMPLLLGGSPFMVDRDTVAVTPDNVQHKFVESQAAQIQDLIAHNLREYFGEPEGKTTVNSKPLYIGRFMVLSDQDFTFLKHHILSSAVMGTVFAGIIGIISNPDIPLLERAALMGVTLTGMQAVLVGVSNVVVTVISEWKGRRS